MMNSPNPKPNDLEACASLLEACENYKVLRRVPRPERAKKKKLSELRYALIVDTETTGLDLRRDEIFEIGFVLVAYQGGEIQFISDFGNEFREPNIEIPLEVQELTGVTPEMVKGKAITNENVLAPLAKASIVIAHNASFDRPMCERLFPEFKDKPWACSLTEICWREHGFESLKLKYLLMENGYFYKGHRALDDCTALLELLATKSTGNSSYFQELMTSARRPSFTLTVKAPYELRSEMRMLGYKWSSNAPKPGGQWTKTLPSDDIVSERKRVERLEAQGAQISCVEQDAFTRYRFVL